MEDIIPHDYWNQKNEEDIQNLETLNSTVTALHLPNPHFLKRIRSRLHFLKKQW